MKKTKFMRAALLLLVLTLITSCFVGGTFAKYTTSASGSDSARVATWGFNDTGSVTLNDLFKTAYDKNVNGKADVIAPGTTNSATFAFKFSGQEAAPEVAYTFTVNPTITGDYDSLDANGSFKWTLAKGDAAATEYDTVANLLDAIKKLSGDTSGTMTYDPGKLPTAFTSADEVYHIGWNWAFDGNDIADTELGNMQNLENVKITITITATQID